MSKKDKLKIGVVYSTDDSFEYQFDGPEEAKTLEPQKQRLRVYLDTKHRAGKKVTAIEGFIGTEEDLELLCKTLKTKVGTGGSAKDGIIIIQGDMVAKVKDILQSLNYKIK